MKKKFSYILTTAFILQVTFGFVLPAQAQFEDNDASNAAATAGRSAVSTTQQQQADNPSGTTLTGAGQLSPSLSAQIQQSITQAGKDAKTNNIAESHCSWVLGFSISRCIGISLLGLGTTILSVAGIFLNFAVEITIVKMSNIVNEVGVITAGWKVFRDLANMFFIFILIYIAIMTITGASTFDTRKSLVMVIVIAMLINFSLFFTKVVVDASNILAIQFYNSITKGDKSYDNGLSWVFMNASRLTTIYPSQNAVNPELYQQDNNVLVVGFMGLIFSVILSFCFLSIGILLIIRFVVLLFVMMLSPLALLGLVVSGMGEIWNKWKGALIKEAVFAPIIMAMLWVVATIINNKQFALALGMGRSGLGVEELSFATAITKSGSAMLVVVNFGILIAMLISGMIIAKTFSGHGSNAILNGADKWARRGAGAIALGGAGFIGRNTVGWSANKLANTKPMQQLGSGKSWAGRFGSLAQKATKGIASSSFDVRSAPIVGAQVQKMGTGAGVEGGFVEQKQKFRTIRDKVFQRDEATLNFQDKEKKKVDIKEGIEKIKATNADIAKAGGITMATDAQKATLENAKAQLKQNLSKLSEEEQIQIASDWHKSLGIGTLGGDLSGHKEIITALSPSAIKAIKRKAGLTPKERDDLTKIREEDLRKILKTIEESAPESTDHDNAVKNLQKMSGEEFEIISADIFEKQEFIENLSKKQTKSLLESKEIASINKDKFKKLRQKTLEEAIALAGEYGASVDIKKIEKLLDSMVGDEFAKLNIKNIIGKPGENHFLNNLSPRLLADAAEGMRGGDITILRTASEIHNRRPPAEISPQFNSTYKWMTSPSGERLFR